MPSRVASVLLCGSMLVALGCRSSDPGTTLCVFATEAVPPNAADVGARVLARLRCSPFIRMTVNVRHEDDRLTARTQMGRDRLRTDVFRGDQRVITVAALDGKVQEFAPPNNGPDGPTTGGYEEYDADGFVGSTGNLHLVDAGTACEFGTLTQSWFGPKNTMIQLLTDRIAESTFQRWGSIDGHRCMVFRKTDTVDLDQNESPAVLQVSHLYFIDAETMDLRRWTTTQTSPDAAIRRIRDYSDIEHADSDAGWAWRLDPDHLPGATKTADDPVGNSALAR